MVFVILKCKVFGFVLFGMFGYEGDVVFELKIVVDIVFVGYFFVGKLSLIGVIFVVCFKIVDYLFMMLYLNLGVV